MKLIKRLALILAMTTLGGARCGQVQSAGDLVVQSASAEDCSIFAAVARGELITKEGKIDLSLTTHFVPTPSRREQHAGYVERNKGTSDPGPRMQYRTWVEEDRARVAALGPLSRRQVDDLVRQIGAGNAAPYQIECDWSGHGLKFGLRTGGEARPEFEPWLAFGRPYKTPDGKFAVVPIDYGYAPTFARIGRCLVERQKQEWKFVKCVHSVVS